MRDLALVGVLIPLLAMAAARPFVGVLVWSWISFMNPHREAFGFAQTMPWAMLAFAATVLGCFIRREPKSPAINLVTILLAVFLVDITLTTLVGIGRSETAWAQWDRTVKILVGLMLTASLLTERARIHALLWVMVISLGFYGVKGGIFTLITGGGFIVLGPPETIIADRNHLAVAVLVTIPLMNYLRLQSPHYLVRIGLMAAMLFSLFAVVGSQSRGALLGLVATAAMLWLRNHGKIVSGIAIGAGIAAAITFMPDSWFGRMNSLNEYYADASAMGRVRIWETAWRLAVMRPLVGAGFRATYSQDIVNLVTPGTTARAVHSIWFEVLGEHGFPGLLIWCGIVLAGIVYSIRITRLVQGRQNLRWAGDLARFSQVSIVAFLVGGTFLSLNYWDFFWTLMVIIAATHQLALEAVRQTLPALPAGTGAVSSRLAGGLRRPSRGLALVKPRSTVL
jgi:probable O-glycosylation ligase (exosortase A-associated)